MSEVDQCFENFNQWVSSASFWLTNHKDFNEKWFRAICFDSNGKICRNGRDFEKAEYPVYYIWPDQNLFNMVDSVERKEQ